MKRRHTQFTCVKFSSPVKTVKFTCSYAVSPSRILHAIPRYKARKSRVISPAGCRLTCLQIAGKFFRGMIAGCRKCSYFWVQLRHFCLRLAGIFTFDSSVFASKMHAFLPGNAGNFAASRRQICMSAACKITCEIPVMFK